MTSEKTLEELFVNKYKELEQENKNLKQDCDSLSKECVKAKDEKEEVETKLNNLLSRFSAILYKFNDTERKMHLFVEKCRYTVTYYELDDKEDFYFWLNSGIEIDDRTKDVKK